MSGSGVHEPGMNELMNSTSMFTEAGSGLPNSLRDDPTPDFIEQMRARYPTEREYDQMLTRKLERRAKVSAQVVGLADMDQYIRAFLNEHIAQAHEVRDVRWLSGGASKVQVAFTLDWNDPEVGPTTTDLVVRMEPTESLNSTSRRREFQLLTAMRGAIPVPRTYWLDEFGSWFPEPAIIYAFARGTTKPSNTNTRVSGTGTRFSPELRAKLAPQLVGALAAIHTFDITSADFSAFDVPTVGTTDTALWQLNRARRVWEEDRFEDIPLVELASNWLLENMPILDDISVLHGDFRTGNYLFDEPTGTVTAWLDWERGYLGDRHRDLAWGTLSVFGNLAEDGKTLLVSGLMPMEEFLEQYQLKSGLSIDPVRLHYYRVFNSYQLVISNLASAYRVAHLGKSHQDVLLAWIQGVVYPFMGEMLDTIEAGPQ